MRKNLFVLAGVATLLTACGNTEQAFNREFDENFSSSCLSSAVAGGVPADAAAGACDCALKEINAKFSTTEKVSLSPEQARPIMTECMAKVAQGNG